jgi:hypothetical protein
MPWSCSKRVEVKYENGTGYIRSDQGTVSGVRRIDWKVGKYGKDIVSRGFRLSFELPVIEEEGLRVLYEKRNVDAWLIRLRRKQGLRNETMAYFAMNLVSAKPSGLNELRFQSPRKGSVGIYYAASSISTRLDSLPCPALGHRLYLDEVSLESASRGQQMWVVSAAEETSITAKVDLISYSPLTVNGGMKLKGEYFIDIAFYNSSEKKRMSAFLPVNDKGLVEKESPVTVKGCENYVVPDKGSGDPVKKFRFGR